VHVRDKLAVCLGRFERSSTGAFRGSDAQRAIVSFVVAVGRVALDPF
jgi:hypothetical protein